MRIVLFLMMVGIAGCDSGGVRPMEACHFTSGDTGETSEGGCIWSANALTFAGEPGNFDLKITDDKPAGLYRLETVGPKIADQRYGMVQLSFDGQPGMLFGHVDWRGDSVGIVATNSTARLVGTVTH